MSDYITREEADRRYSNPYAIIIRFLLTASLIAWLVVINHRLNALEHQQKTEAKP